jgi:threonine dehydrogenase-like Zn-dependent dehydrogenase
MRAVGVFPNEKKIRLVDHEEPRVSTPTEVKVRLLEVGVDGTDKEIVSFEYGSPPRGFDYLVTGHEALGEVVEVGPGVSRLRVGDLVVPTVRRPCPHAHCRACRADRQDFCFTGDFTERGISGRHGYLTERIVDDEKYMVPVPRNLRDVAVLTEPLTIAEKAILQIWKVQERLPWACPSSAGKEGGHCLNAVVLGAGPVGLLGAMALGAQGMKTFVYSREPAPGPKSDLVESIGATYVSATTDSFEDLARKAGNIDVVYEASGASRASFELMRYLGSNAVFVFTGVPGRKAPVEVDTDLIMRRLVLNNQVVFGTVNAGRDAFEAAIRDLGRFEERWPKAPRSIVTTRVPLEEIDRDLLLGGPGGIKTVVRIA